MISRLFIWRFLNCVYRSPLYEAIAIPDLPSARVYENATWKRSLIANRPRCTWVTEEPNNWSPGWINGMSDSPPDTSRKMPVGSVADVSVMAANAIAPPLLIEGWSVLRNGAVAGL